MDPAPKLTPAELALGISRLLATVQAQTDRITALEAQVAAADRLADESARINRSMRVPALSKALAAFRAAKGE